MGIICESCGRDIDALGQDNMSCTSEPLCEDCWNERQSHAVAALKRENASLRRRNESPDKSRKALGLQLAEANRRMREDGANPEATKFAAGAVKDARLSIETVYKVSRERALALTKLDECEMWLGRCEPKETAAPTLKGAAQEAAMPCLKADEVRGFAMPDVNVEVKPGAIADVAAKCLREAMHPVMRMAVEEPWSRRRRSAAPASRCAAPRAACARSGTTCPRAATAAAGAGTCSRTSRTARSVRVRRRTGDE